MDFNQFANIDILGDEIQLQTHTVKIIFAIHNL